MSPPKKDMDELSSRALQSAYDAEEVGDELRRENQTLRTHLRNVLKFCYPSSIEEWNEHDAAAAMLERASLAEIQGAQGDPRPDPRAQPEFWTE